MWFFKWWWLITLVLLNICAPTLSKKTSEAPPSTAGHILSSNSENSDTLVLDYKSSFDTILKDLVNNWQSPITYLKSRGYLTKELEQAARDKLKTMNVVTPLPVEKPSLLFSKMHKKNKKIQKRFVFFKDEFQKEKQFTSEKNNNNEDDETAQDLQVNLDKENLGNQQPSVVAEEVVDNSKVIKLPLLELHDPNFERRGKAIKNPPINPRLLVWNDKSATKAMSKVHNWNFNDSHKQRDLSNWDSQDYKSKKDKDYLPETVVWEGDTKYGSYRKSNAKPEMDWNDDIKYMPTMYHWDSEHNRLLFRKPSNDYMDRLAKKFSNRKRIGKRNRMKSKLHWKL